jgi:hypothetical protein
MKNVHLAKGLTECGRDMLQGSVAAVQCKPVQAVNSISTCTVELPLAKFGDHGLLS